VQVGDGRTGVYDGRARGGAGRGWLYALHVV
jgi:hypothetical protein